MFNTKNTDLKVKFIKKQKPFKSLCLMYSYKFASKIYVLCPLKITGKRSFIKSYESSTFT